MFAPLPSSDSAPASASSSTRKLAVLALVVGLVLVAAFVLWLRRRGDEAAPLVVPASSSTPVRGSSDGVDAPSPAALPASVFPPDADHDGLPDEAERASGTDPKKADTDGDGFNDYEEVSVRRTDPLRRDPPAVHPRAGLAPSSTAP